MRYEGTTVFLIVANPRTGGTFLSHCLDSHRDIFCHRAEPFHQEETIKEFFPDATDLQLARISMERWGYLACGIKVLYSQLSSGIRDYMIHNGGRIIHLTRKNAIRVAVSDMMRYRNKEQQIGYPTWRRHPQTVGIIPQDLDPEEILARARQYTKWAERTSVLIDSTGLPCLNIAYTDMVGAEGNETHYMDPDTGRKLCEFLGVETLPLYCRFFKVGGRRLEDVVSNWLRVERMVRCSEYARCLDDEVGDPREDEGLYYVSEEGAGPGDGGEASRGGDQPRY